jgi:hypothetical protein
MAKDIHIEASTDVDASALSDAERAQAVAGLRTAHGHGGVGAHVHDNIVKMFSQWLADNDPALGAKWKGLKSLKLTVT